MVFYYPNTLYLQFLSRSNINKKLIFYDLITFCCCFKGIWNFYLIANRIYFLLRVIRYQLNRTKSKCHTINKGHNYLLYIENMVYVMQEKKIIFFEFIVQIKVFLKVILLKNRRLVQCLVIIGEVFELFIFLF